MLQYLLTGLLRGVVTRHVHSALREAVANSSQPAPAWEGPCQIALFAASAIELQGLCGRLQRTVTTYPPGMTVHEGLLQDRRVILAETGVGRQAAEQAVLSILHGHRPQWVIAAGFASGLVDRLRPGDMLMANEVSLLEGRCLDTGLRLNPPASKARPAVHVGRLLTTDRIVRLPADKAELARRSGALAVDMESFAVAEVCSRLQVRFLAVRVISDGLGDELPHEAAVLSRQTSVAGQVGAALGSIVNRPGSLRDLWQLKESAIDNSEQLARFLEGVVVQLAPAVEPDA